MSSARRGALSRNVPSSVSLRPAPRTRQSHSRVNNILAALAPIFVLIALGWLIRRRQWIDERFWLPCERLNYFCMFPVLMFVQVARADFSGAPIGALGVALLGAVAIAAGLLLAWKRVAGQSGPVFCSVIQGALRPNTYVGVAAAALLYGRAGVTMTSLAIAIAIPVLNIGSIIVLMVHGGRGRPSPATLALALARNPVIVAICLGLAWNALHVSRLPVLFALLDILGGASLPLGLMAVGAGLELGMDRDARSAVLLSSAVKLVVVPIATAGLARAGGLSGVAFGVAVLFNALPCTPSAYIMSRLLGGDHRLAAAIISIQTIAAAATIPLVLAVVSRLPPST